jgi:hypothetical protein
LCLKTVDQIEDSIDHIIGTFTQKKRRAPSDDRRVALRGRSGNHALHELHHAVGVEMAQVANRKACSMLPRMKTLIALDGDRADHSANPPIFYARGRGPELAGDQWSLARKAFISRKTSAWFELKT